MPLSNIHFNPPFFYDDRFSSFGAAGWDVYWLIGQSNMVGRAATRASVDDNYTLISGRVFQFGYNSQSIVAATNPLDHADENNGQMGLWLEFVKAQLRKTPSNRNILLVPAAQGGTSFAGNHWNPGDAAYNAALARLSAAMGQGSGQNRLVGALWLQGETDANLGETSANAYAAKIQSMYGAMVGNAVGMTASTPFIVGTIKPDKTYAPIVNGALANFASSNGPVEIVDLSDLAWFDSDHYDAASLAAAGQRYAGKFK